MTSDPGFVAVGSGGEGRWSTSGYRLKDNSALVGAGKWVEDNGGRDFWGNPLKKKERPSIGVHEPQ
jgi:hypothetical protein